MTQANPKNTDSMPPATRDPAADTDPLLHLHKMSTTAGVGVGDYVAVNITAVVAVLFGLGSVLAYFGPVLLVIPVVGILLALTALSQIRNSNGTQTGRSLALAGLLLSGAISGYLLISQAFETMHLRADEQAVAALCEHFGQLLAADTPEKFDEAYDLFDSTFHDRVSRDAFKAHVSALQDAKNSLPIESITWNGLAEITDDADGSRLCKTVIKVDYRDAGQERMDIRLEKRGDTWKIDNIPPMFPKLTGASAANAAGKSNSNQ